MGDLDVLEIQDGEAVLIWLAAALSARGHIVGQKEETLLTLLADRIVQLGNAHEGYLAVMDGTMAVLSNMTEFLDLRTGSLIPPSILTRLAIETVSFSLKALWDFHSNRLSMDAAKCPT